MEYGTNHFSLEANLTVLCRRHVREGCSFSYQVMERIEGTVIATVSGTLEFLTVDSGRGFPSKQPLGF